jgi:hypothetical protein
VRDALHRQLADDQLHRRTMQPETPDGFGRGLALHRVVDPVKVIGRHASNVGKTMQIEGIIEMIAQPREHPFEADGVVAASGLFVHAAMLEGAV